jgi:glutamine amidotransferase
VAQRIAVIDYGMSNLRSVAKAMEHVVAPGDVVVVTDDPETILASDRVVFPGQGAARDCMAAISEHRLNQAILEAARSKPFLGICMGLQVLLEWSEENEGTPLLGLIPGRVERFPAGMQVQGLPLKIPHMGWNRVAQRRPHFLWGDIPDGSRFYFVHSYFVVPQDPALTTGSTDYGVEFTSVLARGNLFATQFHPEKSADQGLRLLANFARWNP